MASGLLQRFYSYFSNRPKMNTLTTVAYVIIPPVSIYMLVKLYLWITTGRYVIRKSLKGKHILITGGTSGIGKQTARILAENGASVHLLARDTQKAKKVIECLQKKASVDMDLQIHECDLSSFQSIRSFATRFLMTDTPIHVLLLNAGVMSPTRQVTVDGNEETIQDNHLGHFLLANLLTDRMISSGPDVRIINITSLFFQFFTKWNPRGYTFDVHDLNFKSRPRLANTIFSYAHCNMARIMFTREMARRMYGKGVSMNCCHPGVVQTDLARSYPWWHPMALVHRYLGLLCKTPTEGAQTSVFLAVADEAANISGHYFADCMVAAPNMTALDDKMCEELWSESEKLTKLNKL